MRQTAQRLSRLFLAAGLVPGAALAIYLIARHVDGEPETIGNNGSAIGVLLVIAAVFGISFTADSERWSERAGISLGLSAAFFLLTWVEFGDPSASNDASPHLVWYAVCVLVFAPAVILIPASQWVWANLRERRQV